MVFNKDDLLSAAVLEWPVRDTVKYWGGVLDRQAGHRVSFVTFAHMKYADASRPRHSLAWLMGSFGKEMIDLSDEKIIEAVTEEFRKAGPVDVDSVKSASVVRHLHTYPKYKVEMFEKLLHFKASEDRPAGLFFAGDHMAGGLIEGAARSGYKAARKLIVARSR